MIEEAGWAGLDIFGDKPGTAGSMAPGGGNVVIFEREGDVGDRDC